MMSIRYFIHDFLIPCETGYRYIISIKSESIAERDKNGHLNRIVIVFLRSLIVVGCEHYGGLWGKN